MSLYLISDMQEWINEIPTVPFSETMAKYLTNMADAIKEKLVVNKDALVYFM